MNRRDVTVILTINTVLWVLVWLMLRKLRTLCLGT
jgi:hypothetical protein